jgi:hypothetical protein
VLVKQVHEWQQAGDDRADDRKGVGKDRVAIALVGKSAAVIFQLVALSAELALALSQIALQGHDLRARFCIRFDQLAAVISDSADK